MKTQVKSETVILRKKLHEFGISCPESYEWIDGEAWYRGEPIQGRATENEQNAINATMQAFAPKTSKQSDWSKLSGQIVGGELYT